MNVSLWKWLILFALAILATTFAQLSLFIPTISSIAKMHMLVKLGLSILLLFVQWMFIIPFIRVGLTVMNPIQITIFISVVTFIVQLFTNVYVFGNANTLDDYVASVLMILGIIVSKMRLFG
jgi:hypothetical protein